MALFAKQLFFLLCCYYVKANPVGFSNNDALVMSGNVSLQEMNNRNDRQVMFIALDKSERPCSPLIPDRNPVCVFCLNNACDNVVRGQKLRFISNLDSAFCKRKYRIITTPRSDVTCQSFLRQIIVESSVLTTQ